MPSWTASAGLWMSDALPVDLDLAGIRPVCAEDRPHDLRPARPDQPGDAEDLALVEHERDVAHHPAAGEAADLEDDLVGAFGDLRRRLVDRPPDHHVDDDRDLRIGGLQRRDVAPVAHHRHAVRDLLELLEPVRDVDDPDAVRTEVPDDPEQLVDLRVGERRRRLVHHQDGGIERQRLGDLDHLLLGDLEVADTGTRIELEVQALDQLLRLPIEPPIVEQEARPAARLAAEEDVLGDRQVRRQVQLLVDHADAKVQRGSRVGDLDRLPLEPDLAGVGLVHAGQDLHQRGLAGAVLADQGVDLAGTELEACVGERVDAGEVLGDPGHLDQQVTHRELLEACRPQWDGAATSMRQPRARLSGSNVGYWYRTAWISGSLMLVLSYQ